MSVKILQGDVREMLATLPDESVHCVVTSPPYWGLRCYGVEGQLGLEPTMAEHIETMVDVFREVRRVLRKDGTVWLNYGDCYAGSWGNYQPTGTGGQRAKQTERWDRPAYEDTARRPPQSRPQGTLKPKDLCMIPNRLAIALQDDGWWVRSEIIWAKPNPMPESVTDRPATAHEKVWLLSKSARYFYDAEAVREAQKPESEARYRYAFNKYTGDETQTGERGAKGEPGSVMVDKAGRNLRNVWTIATAPFSEAHFATFPPKLAETCIKAGTSEKGCCAECGAPRVRDIEREGGTYQDRKAAGVGGPYNMKPQEYQTCGTSYAKTIGWSPSCKCDAGVKPCVVLDPFGGSGTTGLVADRLGRNAVLIELNPEYAEMARKRIEGDAPLFAEVS